MVGRINARFNLYTPPPTKDRTQLGTYPVLSWKSLIGLKILLKSATNSTLPVCAWRTASKSIQTDAYKKPNKTNSSSLQIRLS